MKSHAHIFGGGAQSTGESNTRRARLVEFASTDAHRNIGRILISLRRTGIEYELSETEITQIEQGIISQIVEDSSYERHRSEALVLLQTIRTRRRTVGTLGGLS